MESRSYRRGRGTPPAVPRVARRRRWRHDGAPWLIRPQGAHGLSAAAQSTPGAQGRRRGRAPVGPLPLNFVWLVLGVLTVLEAAQRHLRRRGTGLALRQLDPQGDPGRRRGARPRPRRLRAGGAQGVDGLWDGPAALVHRQRRLDGCLRRQPNAPYPSFADAFWLAWYPLMALGIFYLIRVRVPQFELHRWMDGIAVTLLVLAVGFALVIQPAADHKTVGNLATFVVFLYPVLDVLLIGAVLGVYGLLGWRPDTMWILIGLAIVSSSVADAVFAVQEAEARAVVSGDTYDFIWTLGARRSSRWRPGPGPQRLMSTPSRSPGCVRWRWLSSRRLWPSAFRSTRSSGKSAGASGSSPSWCSWWLPCRSS